MPLVRKPGLPSQPTSINADDARIALESGTYEERWQAARAMAGLAGGARALGEALARERDKRVREAIFTGLVRVGTPEVVDIVLPFLRSDDAHLRTGALDSLRAMKDVVKPCLPVLLRDADADVRILACELTRNLPSEEAARMLCELLDEELEPNVCASALDVLAEVGGPEVLPVLDRCANRFRGMAFLDFSIKLTADRIRSQASSPGE